MNILSQFADYAATRRGEFQTEDCTACPMADFARELYPEALQVNALEACVVVKLEQGKKHIWFPTRFFANFVEHAGTWEELTARLRRAAQ